jgi:hypothetical protein
VEYTAVRPKERQQTMSAMLTLQTGVRFPKVLTPFFGPSVFVDVFIAQTTTNGTCTNMSARDCTRSAAVPCMDQAVSRLVTAEACVRERVSPYGMCGGQSGNGIDFPQSPSVFPVSFIPPLLTHVRV